MEIEDGREIDFKGMMVRVSSKGRNQGESNNQSPNDKKT